MNLCKHLSKNCVEDVEYKNFLTNDEKMLLLDNLSQECLEFGSELSLFLTEHSDMNYSAYFYRNYRKLMNALHMANKELSIKNTGENVIISDTFSV
jgi:hypothetical protein